MLPQLLAPRARLAAPVTLAATTLLALSSLSAPAAPPDPVVAFERELPVLAGAAGGTAGVAVVHVESGRRMALRGGEAFATGSVFKLPLALAVLSRVDEGKLSLDEKVEVRRQDVRRYGPIEASFRPGMTLTLWEVVERMMVDSDNTAADLLFRRIGGPPGLAAWLKSRSLAGIDVPLTELELAAESSGVTGLPADGACDPACFNRLLGALSPEARQEGERRYEKSPRNTATPDGLALLLVRLHRKELLSPASTERLLDAMRRCATGEKRIRALLPPGTPVSDKTGTIGRSVNDAALVTLPAGKGTLAVVVLLSGSDRPSAEREAVLARVARAAYDAFVAPRG